MNSVGEVSCYCLFLQAPWPQAGDVFLVQTFSFVVWRWLAHKVTEESLVLYIQQLQQFCLFHLLLVNQWWFLKYYKYLILFFIFLSDLQKEAVIRSLIMLFSRWKGFPIWAFISKMLDKSKSNYSEMNSIASGCSSHINKAHNTVFCHKKILICLIRPFFECVKHRFILAIRRWEGCTHF